MGNKHIFSDCTKTFGLGPAAFLQKLHYWLSSPNQKIGITHDDKRWIYNTYEEWSRQIGVPEGTLRRHVNKLEKLGVILSCKLKRGVNTKSYTIDYEKLSSFFTEHQDLGFMKKVNNHTLKESRPSAQNEQIIYRTLTTTLNTTYHAATAPVHPQQVQQDIVQKMLDKWNDWIKEDPKKTVLTSKRIAFLKKALNDKFHGSLEEWASYCRQISSSDFLMGKAKTRWKATLDWALKFDTIQNIREGQYGVEPPLLAEASDEIIREGVLQQIESLKEITLAKELRKMILKKIRRASEYCSWFKDIKITLDENIFRIFAPNKFKRDWLYTYYESLIRESISVLSDNYKFVLLES